MGANIVYKSDAICNEISSHIFRWGLPGLCHLLQHNLAHNVRLTSLAGNSVPIILSKRGGGCYIDAAIVLRA